jgi:hypothetical protein
MAINFNTEPYFDDYDEDNKYLRVLYRPGFPVQARELTQLQTILQNQISRHGDHIFKDGAMVIPGQIGVDINYEYVKLQPTYTSLTVADYLDQFVGKKIYGNTTGVTAQVVNVSAPTATEPATLFVKYTEAGTDTVTKKFADNELIQTLDATTVRYANTFTQDATGVGSAVSIQRGVYYVKKHFALVEDQTIILDKYSNTPSYKIGLEIDEQLITPEEATDLLDNAQGSPNFAAPGAHRYQINLTLIKREFDATDNENFIELLRTVNGEIQYQVKTTQYAELERTLARRTYDESGNYVVRNFGIDPRQHRNNYRGLWTTNTTYRFGDIVKNSAGNYYTVTLPGTSPLAVGNEPSHTAGVASDGIVEYEYTANPRYNRGIYDATTQDGDESKLAVGIEAGKAYVFGYEVERIGTEYVTVPKARTFNRIIQGVINTSVGNYVIVNNAYGAPNPAEFERIDLYDAYKVSASSPSGNKVGTARVRYFELHNGNYGTAAAQYKMSLFDIQMLKGVTNFNVTDGGSRYGDGLPQPAVTVAAAPAGGTNATAEAITSGGQVIAVVITNPGSGYETAPAVTIEAPKYTAGSSLDVDTSADTIDLTPTTHYLQTGDAVVYTAGTGAIGGLTDGTTYYVIRVDASTIQLATSLANAEAGTEIDLTTTGTGTQTFSYAAGQATAVSVVDYFDFGRNTKGFYQATGGSTKNVVFVADLVPSYVSLAGQATATGGGLLVEGNGTKFNLQVRPNDTLITSDGKTFQVGAVYSNTVLYTETAPAGFSGQALQLVTADLQDPTCQLIFPFPYPFIRNVKFSDDTTTDSIYHVRQTFETTTDSSGNVVITTGADNQTFESPDTPANDRNYMVVRKSTSEIVAPTSITLNSTQTTATIATGLGSGANVLVFAKVRKATTAAVEKTKTLTQNATYTTTTASELAADLELQSTRIKIGKADIYRLEKIEMSLIPVGDSGWDTFPTDAADIEDITDRYYLDDGQRCELYDLGAIIRRSTAAAPTGIVRVTFDYFAHSAGDYFSVASYSGINYEDIPPFVSPVNGKAIRLADVLDFRPRIDDTGANFRASGSSASNLPARGNDFQTSYSYFLGRKDKIVLTSDGQLVDVQGIPESVPRFPADLPNGMTLYNIELLPYTLDTTNNNVIITPIDNRRYTMRDIGALERRIAKLEEYTKLSAVEIATLQREVFEYEEDGSVDPNAPPRLKLGFVVDSFTGFRISDVENPDFTDSVDLISGELRPSWRGDDVNLVEKNTTLAQRRANNYQITGGLITLPYTEEAFITQNYASRTENVNPFAIFTFIGTMKLNPETDEWIDVRWAPDVVQSDTSNRDEKIAEAIRAGGIGTIWGAWNDIGVGDVRRGETQERVLRGFNAEQTALVNNATGFWRNRSTFSNELIARHNIQPGDRVITTAVDVRDVTIQRTGVNRQVVEDVSQRRVDLLETREVAPVETIPYMRSRPVLFFSRAMKAGSKLFPFFEDVNVSDYVTPAAQLSITAAGETGTWDNATEVGSNSSEVARTDGTTIYDGSAIVAFNKGDIIRGDTSGATAILVFRARGANTGDNPTLHIVNVKGTFQNGETIRGSISGATGVVAGFTQPTNLVVNFNGDIAGVFNIPSTESVRFRTGAKTFRLIDVESNQISQSTTRSSATYTANGILENRERVIAITRTFSISETEATPQTRDIVREVPGSRRVVGDTGWYDPLAQTFEIRDGGGCFLTKVDLYFRTRDESIPVRLEVRETVNGYPGRTIIGKAVYKAAEDVFISEDASIPTSFVFERPLYLENSGEYCFVVLSDSNNYNMWISQVGESDISTGDFISKQPYMGVMFKSQNNSTWTAEQMQDMKFQIYRANFNTNVSGVVDLVNDKVPNVTLAENAMEFTSGSGVIKITQPDHGYTNNSRVFLSGFTDATSYNGILGSQLNGIHLVTVLDLDRYTITSLGTATDTLIPTIAGIRATDNNMYDIIKVAGAEVVFPETNVNYSIKTTSGKSIHGSETPYIQESSFTDVPLNTDVYLEAPRIVASEINEDSFLGGEKSLTVRARLSSANPLLSPVIDLSQFTAKCFSNRINSATVSNTTPFIAETSPNSGSQLARYLTRSINLDSPASGLRIYFDANIPHDSDIEVYYKAQAVGSTTPYELQNWTLITPIQELLKTQDYSKFYEFGFDAPSIPQFTSVSVKLVFKSINSSAVPRVKNLRIIMLA